MAPSEFGTYIAGYGGIHGGDLGYLAMRIVGHAYEIAKGANEYWLDDPEVSEILTEVMKME